MKRFTFYVLSVLMATITPLTAVKAQTTTVERSAQIQIDTSQYLPSSSSKSPGETAATAMGQFDPGTYTLGANDVVQIDVLRHPEFSDKYAVNEEGKIQYKFVGDIDVKGLTKKGLEDKLKEALAKYVVSPEVSVTILEYGSKVFYIMGEVSSPGQFIMKSEGITLRDAIHLAGLPTLNASMRKCKLITPSNDGKVHEKNVDLYSLLYYGNLKDNVIIKPGDIFYVPSTVMTKAIRTLQPFTTLMGLAASPFESAQSGKSALHSLKHNSNNTQ